MPAEQALFSLPFALYYCYYFFSAYAMPKMRNPLEGELSAAQVASHLLMPGPVILPGKVENVDPNCVLCKKIVTLVDTMLKENATKVIVAIYSSFQSPFFFFSLEAA